MFCRFTGGISSSTHLKYVSRRLFENPSFSIIIRDDFHRNREITVANEDVDGLADAQKRFRLSRTLFGGECCDECQSKHAQPSRVSHNIRATPIEWIDAVCGVENINVHEFGIQRKPRCEM